LKVWDQGSSTTLGRRKRDTAKGGPVRAGLVGETAIPVKQEKRTGEKTLRPWGKSSVAGGNRIPNRYEEKSNGIRPLCVEKEESARSGRLGKGVIKALPSCK